MSQKMFKFAPTVDSDPEADIYKDEIIENNLASDVEGTDEETEFVTQWMPSVIPLGPISDYIRIRVTYIDQYAQIYYHLKSEKSELRQIRSNLTANFLDTIASADQDWPVNSACVCKFDADDCFYRATIKENRGDGTFFVQFVDYGNVDIVKIENMRKTSEFGDKPAFARRIVINNILPPENGEMPTGWTEGQIDKLRDHLDYNTINGECQ